MTQLGTLDRETLIGLLRELGAEMDAAGLRADVFVVGGAAMVLAYDAQRLTRDVDAVFAPKSEVYEAAARIAGRHNLEPNWLNDAAKGFLLGDDPAARAILEAPGIAVLVASPEYLLAMKVQAARAERDHEDILRLASLCGLSTADEVLDAAQRWFSGRPVAPKSQFLIEELFPSKPPRHLSESPEAQA